MGVFPKHLVFICVPLFRTVLANHVLISIFELGSKLSKIVTTETVTTETCHLCFGSDKREYIILIFGGNKQNVSTVMHVFCILVRFSSVLVCKLKFCNVMWSLLKHYCHYQKCAVTTETWNVLSKIKCTELSTKMLW